MEAEPAGKPRSLLILNARVGQGDLQTVAVGSDGRIAALEEKDEAFTLDAQGRLVLPAFAEPHVHLDRAFSCTLTGWNVAGTLAEAIQRFHEAMELMTPGTLTPGAVRALNLLWSAGVSYVRTHTAVGGALGFRAWEAVEKAAFEVPAIKVQQVPMPVGGLCHPQAPGWLREAGARGAVAIGGSPWLSDDPSRGIRLAADLAAELGIGIDLHMDETDDPAVDTLPAVVAAVEENGLAGRAVAAHCCSPASRAEGEAKREAEALAEAGVAVVVCPVSNLVLQGRQTGLRGIAPVRLLRDASVTVGVGLDNMCDVVVTLGTADPLRAAWLLAIGGHLTGREDLE